MDPTGIGERPNCRITDRSPSVVIATKLVMPTGPRLSLDRPRLGRLLDAGIDGPLTVIVAPAGYGKTVAATGRLAWDLDRTSAWVSLDASDDDPARFWTYIVAALVGAGLEMSQTASPVERLGSSTPGEVLGPLINALAAHPVDITLAIDDFHLVTSDDIHRQVAFLVEQRPPGLHLLLLSRTDPALLNSRLLASGNAVRIGARDLAFDVGETSAFLSTQGVDPGLAEVAAHRLGGWPAALRLLCLWISTQDDHDQAVARFARHDEIVAEYLATEVLNQLDPELLRFLINTSIPSRLNGPLCDALTGGERGAQTLLELHRRGFFVDAIDTDSGWFRYHHLVGEILSRLLTARGQGAVDDLHRRASAWFAANGHGEEAIDHAIAARDWDLLHRLLLTEMLAIGNRHPFPVIEGWLAAVPADVRSSSAIYLLLDGFTHANTGRLDTARTILERAATRIDETTGSDGSASIAALIVTVQAGIARLDADLTMARHYAAAAEAHLVNIGDDHVAHARLAHVATTNSLAATLLWHGDLIGADQRFAEMQADSTRDDMDRMLVTALAGRSLVLAATGQLSDAIALAAKSLEMAGPVGVLDSFQTNPAYLAIALAHLCRGDNIAAHDRLVDVAERATRHGDRAPATLAHLCLAHLSTVAGDLNAAMAHIDATKSNWPSWSPPPPLDATERLIRGRLLLALDDPVGAQNQHDAITVQPGADPDAALARRQLGTHLLAADDPGRAAAFELTAVLARESGRTLVEIAAHLDAALAHHRNGELTDAARCLTAAIDLAHIEDLRSPFLDRPDATRQLLLLQPVPTADPVRSFTSRLLDILGVPAQQPTNPATDRLSERERTVHRLLMGTLTNPEIAESLGITANTLKTHVRNIYRKLGVTNRAAAIIASQRSTDRNLLRLTQ